MKEKLQEVQLKIFNTFCDLCDMKNEQNVADIKYKQCTLMLSEYIKEEQKIIRQIAGDITRVKGCCLTNIPDDYCVIDIETTGLNSKYDEIIELSAIKVQNGKVCDTYTQLVRPIKGVNNFIAKLTGINNDMLKDAPLIKDVIEKYTDFIGTDTVLGYNVNFDINFIYENLKKHKGKLFLNNYVDLLAIAKRKIKNLPNYKLATLAKFFELDTANMHRGLKDCDVTYKCVLKLEKIG